MTKPRLSIVIATYNAAATLEACLGSVLAQDFADWEMLIADGGSTDGTIEQIARYSSAIAWWRSGPDAGIYDAWNQALAHARGEYVAFLGADDAWHTPSTLRHIFEAIARERFDLVTGCGVLIDQQQRSHEFGNPWSYAKVAKRMTICHPGALHRRELFDRYGLFDQRYRISADYEFLLRLPADIRSLHLPVPLVDVGNGGVSRQRRWLMLAERYHIQANCRRIGKLRAAVNLLDKLWRIPVAWALGIPN